MEEIKDLIVVKQLPVIEEQLKGLSVLIDEKVESALSLEVSDETVKDVKKVRAELNADFKMLETKRKEVKDKVMTPYNQFEEIYKTYVSEKFKKADVDLKTKIDNVENEQKRIKTEEVKVYFDELCESENIDFVSYEQANINVTLSASMKSLKEQAKAFVDKICDDLKLIDTQEHKAEILAEYKVTLNVSNAITTVTDRIKREEEEKAKLEQVIEQELNDEIMLEKIENISAPKEIVKEETSEEVFEMTFKVRGTLEQLKIVKEFLENGGYDYE